MFLCCGPLTCTVLCIWIANQSKRSNCYRVFVFGVQLLSGDDINNNFQWVCFT